MRISDWSSDVCSSDLNRLVETIDDHRIEPAVTGDRGQRIIAEGDIADTRDHHRFIPVAFVAERRALQIARRLRILLAGQRARHGDTADDVSVSIFGLQRIVERPEVQTSEITSLMR